MCKLKLYVSLVCLMMFNVFASESTQNFWQTQKKGANFFNNIETEERIIAAKKFGIEFIRLAPNKWTNCGNEKTLGNFLIGSKDNPAIIPPQADIVCLKKILDLAQKHQVKVLLTMISLPNYRWRQHNKGIQERGIFEDFKQQDQAIQFWQNLISIREIGSHPALMGVNVLNEPSPELTKIQFADWYTGDYEAWEKKIHGTPQDLNLFYQKMVKAIRQVNKSITIVLEPGYYATPAAFKILQPIKNDRNILYSVHMGEPYSYTSYNDFSGKEKKNYAYNQPVPIGENGESTIILNKQILVTLLQPVVDFQKKYKIPSNQIIVSEFGGRRQIKDLPLYFKDLLEIFNQNNWHFAFYSFREDAWDGMDYELGQGKAGEKYWKSIEEKKIPDYSAHKNNLLIKVLRDAYSKQVISKPLVTNKQPEIFLFIGGDAANEYESQLLNPQIAGAQIIYSWRRLEPAKGKYDFSAIESDLNFLAKHNKKLFIQVQDRFFSLKDRKIPEYLLTESIYAGGLTDGIQDGEGEPGIFSNQWNDPLRKRFQLLLAELAKQFDGRIHGLNLPETAIDIDIKNPPKGFSCDIYFNATLENIKFAQQQFKKSKVVQYVNFIPCEWNNDRKYMERFFNIAKENKFGLGGPDVAPYRKGQMKNSYPFFCKNKGKLSTIAMAIQEPDYAYINHKTGKKYTAKELYEFATDYLGADIIFWNIQEPQFSGQVLPFLTKVANGLPKNNIVNCNSN